MHKVTKILVKLLSAMVMLLIILPLTISLLLTIPSIQNLAASYATYLATHKIDAKVSLGRVSFSSLNRFTLHDLLVEDQERDTLLFASRADISLNIISLFKGEAQITSAELSDGEFRLREMENSQLNIKAIVERLTNPDKRSDFKTILHSVKINNIDFQLERLEKRLPPYGIDYGNIRVHIAHGAISNFVTQGGITRLTIDNLDGEEINGLKIDQFNGYLTIKDGELLFDDMYIATPLSKINLSKLSLIGESWEDFSEFISNIDIDLKVSSSTLASSDVAYFVPTFEGSSVVVRNLSLSATGRVDDFESKIQTLTFGRNSKLRANIDVVGGEELLTADFDIEVNSLTSNIEDINLIATQVGLSPINDSYSKMLQRMGEIEIKAESRGDLSSMLFSQLSLNSPIGEIRYSGQVSDIVEDIGCKGVIESHNFEVGQLVGNNNIGAINLISQVEGSLSGGLFSGAIDGVINSLGYNNYTYTALDVKAQYLGNELECALSSDDRNIDFDLSSVMRFDGGRSRYDLTLRLNNANLTALSLNRRDSLSSISGSLKVNLEGNDVDNFNGDISLMNVNYSYNESYIYSPLLDIKAQNSDESKLISLASDFADITYKSSSSYRDLYAYLKEELHTYIPLLYNTTSKRNKQRHVTFANNYSSLQVNIKEISPLCEAIFDGFDIADNSSLNFMINPHSKRIMLRAAADYIELRNIAATSLSINANNDKDSLSIYATASDLLYGSAILPSFTLAAGARNNRMGLSAGFRDTLHDSSAILGMMIDFETDQRAKIAITPSNISIGEQMWVVSAKDIDIKDSRLQIDNFAITNGAQHLTLNGAASKEPSDTLLLRLKDYNINMVTSVISDFGYQIDGLSSGEVRISSLFGAPRILADVELDQVDVNSITSPPLRLQALWNSDENRAGIFVTNRQNRDTVMTGYYAPSEVRYYAHLNVDSLNVGLIEPLLSTTIADTRGFANVDVSLTGQRREASLHGDIDLYDMSTRIQYTQVEYFIPSATIAIDDNNLSSISQEVFDQDGNRGLITLRLSLDHLSNLSYRLRMVPENMLVLNTTLEDNELFYGKLYATGVATIEGDKRGVDMDITATSQQNSQFFMPLSSQLSVAKTDFITFVKPDIEESDEEAINFRRRFIEERERERRTNQSTRLNINMALRATPDLDFQLVIDPVVGDIIRAKGEGRLNLAIAPHNNSFEMYGDYNISEGNYLFSLLNPISKRFEIESGSSIQWTGDPIDPQLNIDAIYKVKTSLDPLISSVSSDGSSSSRAVPVDCIIHLGDRLSQPSVDFSIEVPAADTEQQAIIANTLVDQETISQQFFYLMLANSFIPVSSSYGSGLAASTTASTGFELLTNQLSNWLSSDTYNLSLRYRPESEWSSDEIDMGLSRGLIDNRLLIEVEGNYLADTSQSNNLSNFMGEAYITWLIDKAGALRLKGFTQVIDRYDENQGLQETGIGVYYSESFDNIKDLRRRVKDRFSRKDEDEEDDEEDENEEN
ncbi:MAG: translocation/assembly module TamB domain-containing protein [Rikenellaceae bacterium]